MRTSFVQYALALAAMAVSVLLRWAIDPLVGDRVPYLTVLVGSAFAVWLAGWKPTALAAAVGFAASYYFFALPRYGLAVPSVQGISIAIGYAISCGLIILLGEAMRRARQQTYRLAAIIKSSDDAIISTDLDGVITSWNAGAQRLYGYTAGEAVGQPVTMLMPLNRRDEKPGILERIVSGERINHFETVRLRKDGSLVEVSLTVSPVRDERGVIVGASKIARDITRQRRAEEALRESSERYRLVNLASNDVIWDWDLTSDELHWNDALQTTFGYKLADVPQTIQWWYEHLHSDDRERVVADLHAVIDGTSDGDNDRWQDEYRFRRADGTYAMVLDRGHVHRVDGLSVRMIGSMLDLTDRLAAEQALRESEERFRTLADNISQFAWMADENGWIFWYNHRWYDYTGTNLEQMRGWGWTKVHHADHVDRVVKSFGSAVKTGEPWEDIFPLRGKDGEYRWFLSRALPIRNEHGRIVRWFGTNTDITEQRAAEEALARHAEVVAEALAQRTQELTQLHERQRATERFAAMGALAAGVGHDVNNLLLPIQAHLEHLRTETTPRGLEVLKTLEAPLAYIQNLTRSLRLLAQDPTERALESSTNLLEWWVQTKPLLNATLVRKARLEDDVSEGLVARAGTHQLTQIVYNLVQNAGEAIAGRPGGVVTVRAEKFVPDNGEQPPNGSNGFLRLIVSDNGPGMTEEVKRRCMEPFFTTKERSLGGGMGLSMLRSLIESLGGRIELSTTLGRGSTFTVVLPAAGQKVEAGTSDLGPGLRMAAVSIEDDRLRSIIDWLLRAEGVAAVTANGRPSSGSTVWIVDAARQHDALCFAECEDHCAVVLADPPQLALSPRVFFAGSNPKPKDLRSMLKSAFAACLRVNSKDPCPAPMSSSF